MPAIEFHGDDIWVTHTLSRKLMKNVILISVAFLLLFTAYSGLSVLQSSLFHEEGMGVINQAILYAAAVLSFLFLPRLVIYRIGHKWTMALSAAGYTLWVAANGYAVWATMVPASIIVGLCCSTLWTAKSSYVTLAAAKYASLHGEQKDVVIARFEGMFEFALIFGGFVISKVVTSVTLKPNEIHNDTSLYNISIPGLYCGKYDCPEAATNITGMLEADQKTVWILVGTFLAATVLAVIILFVCVDPLDKDIYQTGNDISTFVLAKATLRQLCYKEQLLMAPMAFFGGYHFAFFIGEFTKSFVSCPLGVWQVGWVLIPYGLGRSLSSLGCGFLIRWVPRWMIVTAAALIHTGLLVVMLSWVPTAEAAYALYIISGLYGTVDAVWQAQMLAFVGSLFLDRTEPCYAFEQVATTAGFMVLFATSQYACTFTKICLVLGLLVISVIGYYATEIVSRRKQPIHSRPSMHEDDTGSGRQ